LAMKRWLRVIDDISDWSGRIVSFAVAAGILVLTIEVIARYALGAPTIWAHGTSQRLFAAYYFIAGAYVLRYRGHINVDVLYNRFSPKTKAILDVLTFPLFLATCYVLIWEGAAYFRGSLAILEVCNTPFRAPIYPVKLMIPVSGLLLLLQGIAKFIRDLITIRTGRQSEY